MGLSDSEGNRFSIIRILSFVIMAVGIFGMFSMAAYSKLSKTITVSDGELTLNVKTHADTVEKVLNEISFNVGKDDIVKPDKNQKLVEGQRIFVKRPFEIKLVNGGAEKVIRTQKNTVDEVLKEQNIALAQNDKVNVDLSAKISNNFLIEVTRVAEDVVKERQTVAFKTVERPSATLASGFRKVIKAGKPGQKELTYKVTYENDVQVSKKLLSEKLVSRPVDAIVQVGVEPRLAVARGGENFKYVEVIELTATAYTAGHESTGKRPGQSGYGITATGLQVRTGVVAVDPSVIPLYTQMYIEGVNYTDYGYAIAADTGASIKGNKIDLYFENLSDARKFGVRKVKAYILKYPQ